MGFAKFNVCSPCCNYQFTCHPYTVADIIDPRDMVSATPTDSDLWSQISTIRGSFLCQISTAMHPSGGILDVPGIYPSAIVPCRIPSESFFGIDYTDGMFIESYDNGSLIDLNTTFKKITSNSKQRFDVVRETGVNPKQCNSTVATGPLVRTCDCFEVSGNKSSAWGMVGYQVYPHEFYEGCSSGQYSYINPKYTNCSQVFDICSSDVCNGSGTDKHKSVKLPYCLTTITAEFPSTLPQASINGNRGVPSLNHLYDSSYGICNTGTPYYSQKTSIFSPCYTSTGNIYKWHYKPDIYKSGCNHLYINAPYTTAGLMSWSPILNVAEPPATNLCNNQTRYIIFDCQSLTINTCGTTNFTPTIISDKIGYPVPNYQCVVPNNCPDCDTNTYYVTTFAKKPLSAQVSYTIPGAPGLQYNGELFLDNIDWAGWAGGNGGGCGTWVPNPHTQPCATSTGYDMSFSAFVAATVVSVTFQGYQPTEICYPGFECVKMSACHQNEFNYALIHSYGVDLGFGCTLGLGRPSVNMTYISRFYPDDIQNSQYECCSTVDGSPNGTIGVPCAPPLTTFAQRAASPSNLWNTQSCCELWVVWYTYWKGLFPSFENYCIYTGRPECANDSVPNIKYPQTSNLVNDICNDVMDCSVYDADGNLIYTVTI